MHIFFKCTWSILQDRSNTRPQKKGLNTFKKIEIISRIFPSCNSLKLEINYKKKTGKIQHMETKQHATKPSVGKQRNKSGQEYLETNENESTKSMRHSKSIAKKEVYTYPKNKKNLK